MLISGQFQDVNTLHKEQEVKLLKGHIIHRYTFHSNQVQMYYCNKWVAQSV